MTHAIPPSSAAPALVPAAPAPAAEGPSFPATAAAVAPSAAPTATPPTVASSNPVSPTSAVAATSATTATAQVAQLVATAQAALASSVNLSPQAQQAVKLEAFQQLVTNLVTLIQPGNVQTPSSWPTTGLSPAMHTLVSQLLQQATAPQPLPQQLVTAQAWPALLTQAVLQHTGAALPLPTSLAPAAAPTTNSEAPTGSTASPLRLPALQNWLVQQGSIQAADGERPFTLTLRVPVAWAQAQAALGSALAGAPAAAASIPAAPSLSAPIPSMAGPPLSPPLSGAAPPGMGLPSVLQLPFSGSVQQLANASIGLVMQPQVVPGTPAAAAAAAMRTSALLQLEFQPLANVAQTAQAAVVYAPGQLLPQDVQAMLQGRPTDPWLLMAQAHADGHPGKQSKNGNEQAATCNRAGCQYQGRAICAQPFCAEMNYLWSIDRAQRRA